MSQNDPKQPSSSNCFSDFLAVLFTPSSWFQNYPYCREWDNELNRLIKTERFKDMTRNAARIGGHSVWVSNHPYASFTLNIHEVRPSRATILRAHKKLVTDFIQENKDKSKKEGVSNV